LCVEGVPGAVAADKGGAHRIELCAGLVEGGTTPSLGTISLTLEALSIPMVVLIRPRGGDFLYDDEDLEVLLRDIEAVREAGAFGVATGALTRRGGVDVPAMARIMKAAGPMSVTFHRAFDMTVDALEALETLIELGVNRVLTSGQERSVREGLLLIRELVRVAGDRISIMPGGGIRDDNIKDIIQEIGVSEIGVSEIHFTALGSSNSPMTHRNTRPLMGADRVPGEYERLLTDPAKVRKIMVAAGAYP